MTPLTQVSSISSLIGKDVYTRFGIMTIISHLDGNTWGTEAIDEDGNVQFLAADEMFLIEVGDTVIVKDYDGTEYVGEITRIYADTLVAWFGEGRTSFRAAFEYGYISQILAPAPRIEALAAAV